MQALFEDRIAFCTSGLLCYITEIHSRLKPDEAKGTKAQHYLTFHPGVHKNVTLEYGKLRFI